MAYITGSGRDQLLLLPEAVDDYVEADNSVRFIDVFVDEARPRGSGFRARRGESDGALSGLRAGRPAEALHLRLPQPGSDRADGWSARCRCNVEVIWLLGGLRPDLIKTIADFRRGQSCKFRGVFRQFVLLCRRLDLYGRELLAVDETRIKAVNNKDRNVTRSTQFIRRSRRAWLRGLATCGRSPRGLRSRCRGRGDKRAGRAPRTWLEKIAVARREVAAIGVITSMLARRSSEPGEDQISLTDPDSRAMAATYQGRQSATTIQVAVDAKHKLESFEQAVTNQVVGGHGAADADRSGEPVLARSLERRAMHRRSSPTAATSRSSDMRRLLRARLLAAHPARLSPRPRQRGSSSPLEGFFRKDDRSSATTR